MLSPNELVKYASDLKVLLNKDFKIKSNEKVISFYRTLFINNQDYTLGVGYEVETEDDFTTACENIRCLVEDSLFKFSDQFYIDRSNNVPLVSDDVVDRFNPSTGELETVRLDSIDDWFVPVKFKNKSGNGLKLSEPDADGNYKIL